MPKVFLFCFSVFLIGGNFFRLLPLEGFPSYFSLVEFILYALATPVYFFRFRKSHLLIFCILFSTLYGIILQGIDVPSILYSLKLIGMIGAGVVIGECLQREKKGQGLEWLTKIFSWNLALGGIIFLIFPRAHQFFLTLKGWGIHFLGDPHVSRFISPFFDPNYYSAIACIPFLLAWHLGKEKPRYRFLSYLFFVSILLTWSRSGIATLFFLLMWLIVKERFLVQNKPFVLKQCLVYFSLFAPLLFFYKEMKVFFSRICHIREDPSAYCRLETFEMGMEYFFQRPYFGYGYNFISKHLQENYLQLNIDSSPILTVLNFGLLPSLCFLFGGGIWFITNIHHPHPLFRTLLFYLAVCIFFTSQFNNLLYYQFWLVPMIALFTYLIREDNESRLRS